MPQPPAPSYPPGRGGPLPAHLRDRELHFPRGLDGLDGLPTQQRWARPHELSHLFWQYEDGRFFLGYHPDTTHPLGCDDDRHIFLLAGSRAGKGVSVILPNACLWPGSFIAVDPKGELARKTARTRQNDLKQDVFALDPFDRSGLPCAHFNPLDELVPPHLRNAPREMQDRAAVEAATMIADGLVIGNPKDPHWTDAARFVLKGFILYTMTLAPTERHLVTVRRLLTATHREALPEPNDPNPRETLFRKLARCERFGDTVKAVGLYLLRMAEEERSSIISSAITQTNFLDSPALLDCLSRSDFSLADLKRRRISVYLCLPANRMETHARWLRIIINMTIQALEEEPGKPRYPVLMCLDEFNVLGRMDSLAKAAGELAGFGVKLLTVLQDISQIKRLYQEWETFIGNAGLFLSFGNSDASSLDYISKKLGTTTVTVESRSTPGPAAIYGGNSGVSMAQQVTPLLAPHEVERAFAREQRRMLVMFPGVAPFWVRRCISYEDPNFKSYLDESALDLSKSW